MNCLEPWIGVIRAFSNGAEFKQLADSWWHVWYQQRLIFPLRVNCVRMRNRITGFNWYFHSCFRTPDVGHERIE